MLRSETNRFPFVPLFSAILLGSLLAGSGCKPPTQQSVAQQYATLLKNVADRLDQVQTREDADRAAADIQKLVTSADAIVAQAKQAEASGTVENATQQSVRQQLERISASGKRLREASLLTDSLAAAMQHVGYSSESIIAAAATGKLPPPASPLEEAWVAVIRVDEEHADLAATLTTPAAAEQAIGDLVNLRRKRHAALTKVAQLGGEEPPHGVPENYRKHYDAAQARLTQKDAAVTAMLGQEAVERLAAQLEQAILSDPSLAQDPFRLPSAIRTAATKATVTLINNKTLQGERHQQMIARLKELANASEAESVIEEDGTYRLVLAPVADFARLIQGIDFGDVSERNDQAMTFTLTIDPARFSGGDPGPGEFGPPGRPPFGGPVPGRPGGGIPLQMAREKAQFMARFGGPQKCVTIVLQGAPDSKSPEFNALVGAIRAASGAGSTASFTVNGRQELLIGPVEGFDAWTAKIDFGTVTAKDPAKREITLAVDASKLSDK